MAKSERTIDLSMERGYIVPVPDNCNFKIGKLHGVGKRSNQEDCFGISEITEQYFSEKGIFVALADGMGGMQDGEKASMAAVVSSLTYFDTVSISEGPQDYLMNMIHQVNEDVLSALGDTSGMGGATFIGVHLDGCVAHWISIGDSHLYLYRDEKLIQLNQDHTYGAELDKKVREGQISAEEARNHPQRRALTSYLGISDLEKIDGSEDPLVMMPGDMLLIMTDGVFGTLSEEEIMAKLDNSVGKIAMSLQMEVENKHKPNQDNYTGIIIQFD